MEIETLAAQFYNYGTTKCNDCVILVNYKFFIDNYCIVMFECDKGLLWQRRREASPVS